jgi:hypothetical protein
MEIKVIKKTILALVIIIGLSSCYKEPQTAEHIGNGFKVEFLFEKDGIKVYRFFDGGDCHYFTSKGETMSTQQHGKTSRQENIN